MKILLSLIRSHNFL